MSETDLIRSDIEAFLQRYENKELLRFVVVGSVDDGKSTLIGRLLYDANAVYDDHLAAVKKATTMEGTEIDFSLFTDGLRAEREQGITIDVAYRYFSTETRKFIVADTPGHVQYTRNMATGASTADVAVILVDARLGVLEQSRRHAYIASLLGIAHLLVAVNKMDLVEYGEARFAELCDDVRAFTNGLRFDSVTFIPISALRGDNIVTRSVAMPWHKGATILEYLQTVPVPVREASRPLRFPVQLVLRPNLNYRAFSGKIAAGTLRVGEEVTVLPSGKTAIVRGIDTYSGELAEATAPMSVAVRLDREVDVSRGDMLAAPAALPRVQRRFSADLVWMSETPLDGLKSYLVKHGTQWVKAEFVAVTHRIDPDSLAKIPTDTLRLNDIGGVDVVCHRALYFDEYADNRDAGAFIVVDSLTNATVGAGMIRVTGRAQDRQGALDETTQGSALRPKTEISPRERKERMGQTGVTVWLTGRTGSGRWPLAYALERRLFDDGHTVTVLDPTSETPETLVSAAKAATDAGLVVIYAAESLTNAERERARTKVGPDRFVEVYVNTRLEVCVGRRAEAAAEEFEEPSAPNVTVDLDRMDLDAAVRPILAALRTHSTG